MKNRKRILAGLLAVVMTISILPASVFAADMSAVPAEENDAEPGIVSNEEYEVEPAAEAISDQDAQQETEDPTVETGKNEASEPEDQPETAPVSRTEEVQEAEPVSGAEGVQEAAPASEPEEEKPAKEETEPAAVEEASETEEAAAEKEAAVEPVTLTYEGRDYMVTAAFDPSVFPEGVQMKAKEIRKSNSGYQDLYDQAFETIQKETEEDVEITHVRFFDITFYTDEEDNIEPDGTVNVNIKYTKALTVESPDDISVLHFDEKKEEPQLMEIETSGSTDAKVEEISFDTESFSVYAVIATTGDTGDNARLTVNFFGKNTAADAAPIATMYVRGAETKSDTALASAVYDPAGNLDLSGGYVFNGKWTVRTPDDTEERTIEGVRDYIKGLSFSEGDVLNVYAVLNLNYTVQYLGRDGSTVGSHSVLVEKGKTSAPYTVEMAYSDDDTHKFEGWLVSEGADKISYGDSSAPAEGLHVNGTEIIISGDVKFSVSAPEGHYLVFDENGKHATFNAARFVKSGEKANLTGLREMVRKGYTFEGWYNEAPDEYGGEPGGQMIIDKYGELVEEFEPYYINDTTTLYAKWSMPDTAPYTVIIWKQHTYDNGYDVGEIIHFDGTNGHEQGIPLTVIDTVVLNGQENSHLGYVTVDGVDKKDNPDIFGYGDETVDPYEGFFLYTYDKNVVIQPTGDTVLNVYYNRRVYTLTFKYGTKSGNITARYGTNIGSYFPLSFDYLLNLTEAAARYLMSWNVDEDDMGRECLTYPQGERIRYIDKMPAEDIIFNGTIRGGINKIDCYYYVQALDENGVSYGDDGYKFVKRLSGDGYIRKRANTITYDQDFVQMMGFTRYACSEPLAMEEGASYTLRNNAGLGTYVDKDVYFYYTRNKYTIKYNDGTYVDGDDNVLEEEDLGLLKETDPIFYEADLSTFNKGDGNNNWYDASEKAHPGYVLEGWYLNKKCTTPCTFDKMPLDGIHVYAKWRKIQYRVFLHPNAGTESSDPSLNWGGKQDMNFRVSYMEHVSVPTGTRNGYRFLGWYLDSDLTQQVYTENILLDESMVTDYHKTGDNIDYTDTMDDWGVITNPSNSDATGWDHDNDPSTAKTDRYWITKKFDLWAKWSRVLHGSDNNGIYVIYNANDGDTIVAAPTDRTAHADNTYVVAGLAPSNTPPGKVFKNWKVQKWDGTGFVDTGKTVKPGEQFTVNVENARIVITGSNPEVVVPAADLYLDQYKNTKFTYTIQLKANYDNEPASTTYIPWFENFDKKAPFHIDTAESLGAKSTLAFNKGVGIQTVRDRVGYRFIGWASVTMGNTLEEFQNWYRNTNNFEQALDKSDVFLYYNEDDGKFYSSYNEEDDVFENEVSQIAADSTSYQAMFAVYESVPTFKVYHSSDGQNAVPEEYNVPTKKSESTFNMVKLVKPDYMYGGYYEYDETTKSKYFADCGPGNAMVPGEDQVYYLREVNVNYLKPQLYLIYSKATKVISSVYGLVNVDIASMDEDDQPYYSQCGLLVRNTKNTDDEFELFPAEGNTAAEEIEVMKDGTVHHTLNKENFGVDFKAGGNLAGSPCYIGFSNISKSQYEPYTSYIAQGAELEIKAFYDTPDGIRVTGSKLRKITFEGTEGSTDPVFYNGWKTENNPNGTRTGLVKDETEKIEDLYQDDDGKGRGIQNDDGKKKVTYSKTSTINASEGPVKYTVNMFEGTEKLASQTVEAGNNTGKINIPEKEEYLFIGWFQDEALSVPADFSDVQGDMMVYAGYIPRKDVTLSLARKTGKTGSVTFTATVSIKNTNKFTEVGVICGHNEEETQGALTKKTYLNTGTTKNPRYTYKFSGPVEVNDLTLSDEFTASVYWVTKDGTKVTEDARTCTYSSGSVRVQK